MEMEFVLRHIPDDMHRAWKSTAALKGVTMREYCLVALRMRIQQDMTKMQEVKDNVPRRGPQKSD